MQSSYFAVINWVKERERIEVGLSTGFCVRHIPRGAT